MRRPATPLDSGDEADVALTRLRLRLAGGTMAPPRGLPADARTALALAEQVGAPLLPVLDALRDARDHRRRVDRQVATAAAPARTVGLALVALPVVAVPALSRLLEVDLLAFYTTGGGTGVGAVALLLWVAGAGVVLAMLRHAGRDPRSPGPTGRVVGAATIAVVVAGPWAVIPAAVLARITFRPDPTPPHPALDPAVDLVAAALSAGLIAASALRVAADHCPTLAGPLRQLAWQVDLGRLPAAAPPGLERLRRTLVDGLDAGAPLVPALRALARDVRSERAALAEARALRLPARLTFPTSLLLLPATVLAIGAPIIATGLSAVSGA